ncbi:hypothetical protein AJ87_03275 [Rhizobium yanglingense]|nr:hypothetical protein AJ87_03275 [Rhizobium yanglingense]
MIADADGIESIGGIMGGEHSGCDENTTDVLIECALWDPMNIAKSGRGLGIITDARYRFERGVDPEYMVPGLERTTELVLELCGGTPAKADVVGYKGYQPKTVDFPYWEVRRLTGLEVSTEESKDILTRLGFGVSGSGESVSVAVPSWRPDVGGKADLVEEVMRIHGVDNIKPAPLESHAAVNGKILTTLQTARVWPSGRSPRAACWRPSPGPSFRKSRRSSSAAARRHSSLRTRSQPKCPTCARRSCRVC